MKKSIKRSLCLCGRALTGTLLVTSVLYLCAAPAHAVVLNRTTFHGDPEPNHLPPPSH